MLPLLAILAVLQTPVQTSAAPPSAPSASPGSSAADPRTTKAARAELAAWEAGKPDWSHYIEPIPDATVKKVQAFLAALGPVSSPLFVKTIQPPGVPVPLSVYVLKGATASAYLIIHLNDAGKIDEIFFKPAP